MTPKANRETIKPLWPSRVYCTVTSSSFENWVSYLSHPRRELCKLRREPSPFRFAPADLELATSSARHQARSKNPRCRINDDEKQIAFLDQLAILKMNRLQIAVDPALIRKAEPRQATTSFYET